MMPIEAFVIACLLVGGYVIYSLIKTNKKVKNKEYENEMTGVFLRLIEHPASKARYSPNYWRLDTPIHSVIFNYNASGVTLVQYVGVDDSEDIKSEVDGRILYNVLSEKLAQQVDEGRMRLKKSVEELGKTIDKLENSTTTRSCDYPIPPPPLRCIVEGKRPTPPPPPRVVRWP